MQYFKEYASNTTAASVLREVLRGLHNKETEVHA